MKKFFLGFFLVFTTSIFAQTIDVGGPLSWHFNHDKNFSSIPDFTIPNKYIEEVIRENDSLAQLQKSVFKFGVELDVELDAYNFFFWEIIKKGRVGRFMVKSQSAISLNFIFDQFKLAPNAHVHIYSSNHKKLLGAYTSHNNNRNNTLGTDLIHANEVIIEMYEPFEQMGNSMLRIGEIIHGYKDIDHVLGLKVNESGACNMDVICNDGLPWTNEIKSVVRIVSGGSLCTGTLVNNTAQDGTPYVLTAYHCNPQTMGNAVFRFNYDSPICGSQAVANSQAPSGSPQTVNGSSLISSNDDSDFGLVQLNSVPPSSYDVFYAGWNNSGVISSTAVCIHHPSGDVKKISFDDDPLQSSSQTGISNNMWEVETWERSTTTEGGSSGAGLWDQNHHLVGHLYGGSAACGNFLSDFFGKFSMSWTGNNSSNPTKKLSNWLDPNNSGVNQLDGYSPNSPTQALDGAITGIELSSDVFCSAYIPLEFVFKNNGANNITEAEFDILIDGTIIQQHQWVGSIANNNFTTITFSNSIPVYSAGDHEIEVRITSVNAQTDQNNTNNSYVKNFSNYPNTTLLNLEIELDCWGSEISWQIKDSINNVLWEVPTNYYADVQPNGYTVNEIICLENGCYNFTIYDTYGDGMQGAQYTECSVNGNFKMEDQWNTNTFLTMIANNANFGSSESHDFCVNTNSINKVDLNEVKIYPNPSSGHLVMKLTSQQKLYNIEVVDLAGKIHESFNTIGDGEFDLSKLHSGCYILKIRFNNEIVKSLYWIKN